MLKIKDSKTYGISDLFSSLFYKAFNVSPVNKGRNCNVFAFFVLQ